MHSNAGDPKGSKRLTEFSVQDGSKENIQECNGGKKQRNEVVPAHSTSQNPQEDDGDSVQIVAEDMQDCIECLEDTASTTPSPKIGTWSTIYPDVVPLSEGTLGPLPMVTMDDFACLLQQDGSNNPSPVPVDTSFLVFGNHFDVVMDEKTRLAWKIFSQVTDDGKQFLRTEYPSLVVRGNTSVDDMIKWFEEHLKVDRKELRQKFLVQNYSSFVQLLDSKGHLEMMTTMVEQLSGLYIPVVQIKELKVKISLFELLLHIRNPGVSKTYLLEDTHTVAISHVPALFKVNGQLHLFWSTPWPLGLVELPGRSDERVPFSIKDVLVFPNSMFFRPGVKSGLIHFKCTSITRERDDDSGRYITINATDIALAALIGISIEDVCLLRKKNKWEEDHCTSFYKRHSAYTLRLTTKSENAKNVFRSYDERYLTDDQVTEILGIVSDPESDPEAWYQGWFAHHSYSTADLCAMARSKKALEVRLVRIKDLWFHKETSMICKKVRNKFKFVMPEGCYCNDRVVYPMIRVNIDGSSVFAKVHLILYDSYQRYVTNGAYVSRPVVQEDENGEYCVFVVDHVEGEGEPTELVGVHTEGMENLSPNRIRKMAARGKRLELVSIRENTLRAVGHKITVKVEETTGQIKSADCVGMAHLFKFLEEAIGDGVSFQSLKHWWYSWFEKGVVKSVIEEKNLTISMNEFNVIESGVVSEEIVARLRTKLTQDGAQEEGGEVDRDTIWVFVYFGSRFPRVTKFVKGREACKALVMEHVSKKEHVTGCVKLFDNLLYLGNKCLAIDHCLFRPLNKTPSAEEEWNKHRHVSLSLILQDDDESRDMIAKRYATCKCGKTMAALKKCTRASAQKNVPNGNNTKQGLRKHLVDIHYSTSKEPVAHGIAYESKGLHVEDCPLCLMYAISLIPPSSGSDLQPIGGYLWSLKKFGASRTASSAKRFEILTDMITNIQTHRDDIVDIWESSGGVYSEPVWETLKNLMVFGKKTVPTSATTWF